jgi:16S rRNA (adenine1518-N6/adenine1519-N6)-dimethyltransferase
MRWNSLAKWRVIQAMSDDPLDNLPPLRDVISRYELGARKSLGQNFLLDMNLTDKIVRQAGDLRNATVMEVGPGPGGLSRSILRAGARQLTAVERDHRCIEALADLVDAADGRMTLVEADALKFAVTSLEPGPVTIIANLPYNIATPLLFKWLEDLGHISQLILMFQREVADRICAEPGGKTYGRLSVMSQWHCEVEKLFDLSPRAFVPPPKVTSSVVRFTPLVEVAFDADAKALETVTAAAFTQRRKMIRASMKSIFRDPLAILEKANIDPQRRAETLTVADFCAVARLYQAEKKTKNN